MNEVKIVVTGQNKFASTQAALLKQIKSVEDATGGATKGVTALGDAWDRAASRMGAQLDGLTATARGYKDLSAAVGGAARSFDEMGDEASASSDKAGKAVDDAGRAAESVFGKIRSRITDMADKVGDALPDALSNPRVLGAMSAAALPLGAAAGGAVVLGFGAGLATLGMVTASKTSEVQDAFRTMSDDVSTQWQRTTAPFKQTMVSIAGDVGQAFDQVEPRIKRTFDTLAPAVTGFSDDVFNAFGRFDAFEPLGRASEAILRDLGGRMPNIIDGLSDSFTDLATSIEKNPEALGQFVELLGSISGSIVSDLGTLNSEFGAINEELEMFSNWFAGGDYALDVKYDVDTASMTRAADEMLRIAGGGDMASRSTYAAEAASERLAAVWSKLAAAGSDVTARGDGIAEILDRISGRVPDYEEAQRSLNDSIRGMVETFSEAANHADGYGSALLNLDGTVNTATQNGSDLYGTLQTLKSGFADTAGSVRALEDAGWSHDAAVQRVNSDMLIQNDRLIAAAGQMGLTEQQMRNLLAAYGLTPKDLNTVARLDENGVPGKIDWLARQRQVFLKATFLGPDQIPNGRSPDARAHGGISGGGWTTVGELGPERVKLPSGSQVQPYTASARQQEPGGLGTGSGGGGAVTVTLDLSNAGRATGLERVFFEWLKEAIRGRGGDASVFGGGS